MDKSAAEIFVFSAKDIAKALSDAVQKRLGKSINDVSVTFEWDQGTNTPVGILQCNHNQVVIEVGTLDPLTGKLMTKHMGAMVAKALGGKASVPDDMVPTDVGQVASLISKLEEQAPNGERGHR